MRDSLMLFLMSQSSHIPPYYAITRPHRLLTLCQVPRFVTVTYVTPWPEITVVIHRAAILRTLLHISSSIHCYVHWCTGHNVTLASFDTGARDRHYPYHCRGEHCCDNIYTTGLAGEDSNNIYITTTFLEDSDNIYTTTS